MAAMFPDLEINFSDGRCEKLPSNPEQRINDSSQTALPCVTLLSLSFRASSQVCEILHSIYVPFYFFH